MYVCVCRTTHVHQELIVKFGRHTVSRGFGVVVVVACAELVDNCTVQRGYLQGVIGAYRIDVATATFLLEPHGSLWRPHCNSFFVQYRPSPFA
jgi:hypothetical protein